MIDKIRAYLYARYTRNFFYNALYSRSISSGSVGLLM